MVSLIVCILVWIFMIVALQCYAENGAKKDQEKCKHERYRFIKNIHLYDSNLRKISIDVYECCNCRKIKRDEVVK